MNKQLHYFSTVYVQRNRGRGKGDVFANTVPPPFPICNACFRISCFIRENGVG